ncbi:serine protease [Streptomyces sp. AJS327]|uniref:S1 family peptidase n=1 Tax=Streptomyces sp. AJS327 TaxID=2545265 RepID=UPI0015DE3711|nr:serine protease [Streptomyces sp. AJS327]MBA0051302.1 serine protease [Streptomyces sp. AJS327]
MKRPLVSTLAVALLGAATLVGGAAAPAGAAERPAASAERADTGGGESRGGAELPLAAPDFEGTVALSNCSGSVVRTADSQPGDPALVLSNGHCLEGGMPEPGTVLVDQPSSRSFTLLDAGGADAGTVNATKLAYATMTGTDVSLYQVDASYEEIEAQHGVQALELDSARPKESSAITVVSGYWKETYSCDIDGFVHELREGGWTMKDSIRYTEACETKGGTSGSPIVDDVSGKVVGVNNTGNENGGECTMNNPCEVDENGEVTVRPGTNYGQQTYQITSCVGEGNTVDLSLPECALPKP